jgi:hypothetical protein
VVAVTQTVLTLADLHDLEDVEVQIRRELLRRLGVNHRRIGHDCKKSPDLDPPRFDRS